MANRAAVANPSGKVKVAILGGGPAGLSTAFWLTASEALRKRFSVTVYTPGWRLGGKCASGRKDGRIQEHGLHILMGCYRNLFATMCACYSEWQPRAGGAFQQWSDAFTPQYEVSLPEGDGQGHWNVWNFVFPSNAEQPCQPGAAPPMPALMERLTDKLEPHLIALDAAPADDVRKTMRAYRAALKNPAELAMDATLDSLQGFQDQLQTFEQDLAPGSEAAMGMEAFAAGWNCPGACALILANLGIAVAVGYLRDVCGQGEDGIRRLNELDLREWLQGHGAWDMSLRSAPIRALYALTFAFPDGDGSDIGRGRIAAGVTLRFMLEACFGYAGAPLWKMNAGTGDTLFTPLYQVLHQRGVDFRFYHRVEEIAAGQDGKIRTIRIAQQVRTKAPSYDPLIEENGLDCWPAEPLWGQIQNGDGLGAGKIDLESPHDQTVAGTCELTAGRDFDVAVLATPPDIIGQVAPNLHDSGAWDAMLAHSASVATGAFQLWLKPPLGQLGWNRGSTVLTAFEAPFDSWGDMSHLLARETDANPQTLAYFCGSMPDAGAGQPELRMTDWLRQHIAILWPKSALFRQDGTLDPNVVIHSYARNNLAGSERYVLTPPGSVKFRLSPEQPVFGKLYLAGDWTLTRFSGGCVEAAFESGVLAAGAIQRDCA